MSKLHFGKINNVILIGGGYMLVKSIEIIQSINLKTAMDKEEILRGSVYKLQEQKKELYLSNRVSF